MDTNDNTSLKAFCRKGTKKEGRGVRKTEEKLQIMSPVREREEKVWQRAKRGGGEKVVILCSVLFEGLGGGRGKKGTKNAWAFAAIENPRGRGGEERP